MDNVSKVIFTCLAIGYTFLIYQNNQLKDDVETLKGYAQLDTDKTFDEIDELKLDFEFFKNNSIEITNNNAKEMSKAIKVMNSNTKVLEEVVDSVNLNTTNVDKAFENLNTLRSAINNLPDPKSTYDIKNIIETCKTSYKTYDYHEHKLEC
jgi:hypothetical protein